MKAKALSRRRFCAADGSVGGTVFDIFNYAFITLFCISILFPMWDMIVQSLSRAEDISYMSLNLWPKHVTLDGYKYVFSDKLLFIAFRNSILRTAIGSAYHLVVCCLAAYTMTRHEMPFLKVFTGIFLITMFFSGGMIPAYLNIKNLGLLENFLVYVLPGGFSMYNTIIIRNYFFSIDRSLEESATIDGANSLQIMVKIILPLSLPVLATVGLWQMVAQWNSWFDNMVYCRSDNLITLQYMLKRITNNIASLTDSSSQYAMMMEQSMVFTPQSIIACTTVITVVPIICVYPFLQKYFVKGIMLGAVKG